MHSRFRRWLASWTLIALVAGPTFADGRDIVDAARRQVGVTLVYDGAYRRIAYPGGDVPVDRGVCTDVVIRALRAARQLDLQRAIHEDMLAHRDAYPRRGGGRADANIDHRRVPNQMAWFARQGWSQPAAADAAAYLPGDIVAWDLGGGLKHVGIVSAARSASGVPLVIHNIGAGAREDDILFRFKVIGHFRLP
ncbi:MAG TPA: DUF1287 domain-containing protein [Steroidobacteraceae bacterium]|nr:DUF1287 domain-containing protein [Steroidobacteraceae bacterium]